MAILSPPRGFTGASMVSLLRLRAAERGDRPAFIFLADGEEEGERLTYRELDRRARAIAAVLRKSLAPGDRALLLYPPGLEFIAAFFGCLYAGVIAVPAYPPRRGDHTQGRLRAIARDAGPRAALTTAGLFDATSLVERVPELATARWIATDALEGSDAEVADSAPGTVAFLQYTSGSTGTPKGVMVTHANLLHNERMIQEVCRHDETMVMVGWLPLYHDMGLIGNVLQPIYAGGSCVLMAPVAFLQRPLRWLEAISRYGGHTSGGPNFAYELCLRRIGEEERRRLDLSSWRVAFNGAEPVRAETLERFAAAFASCGFRREALYPCYGLAEATLFVTGGEHGQAPRAIPAASAALEANRWEPPGPGEPRRELVSCGRTWTDLEVAIVDPETRQTCAPGRIGEIWVRGASVAQGYWNRPETTESEFRARRIAADGSEQGPFLRTGDLGFFQDGELFVAGRRKDLIILRGRNHYPQDIEKTVEEAHPALRPGCGAAFSVEVEGEERLVLTCEVERRPGASPEEIAAAVRRAVAEEHELSVHELVLLRIGTVPKTSSGKIQRHACRMGYLDGTLAVVGRVAAALPAAEAVASGEGLDRRTLLALDPDERLGLLSGWLRAAVAQAARIPAERIDPTQPLVRQGLDSLAAVELQQGLEEALGIALSPGELLDSDSLGELAERLLAAVGEVAAAAGPAAAAALREAPLSDGQKALWFLHRLAPGSAAYNIAGAARVRDLRTDALRRALTAVAARHPALRTTFHPGDPEPLQRVREEPEIDFVAEDAAAWSDGELLERLHAEAWRPFDLERGPLLRLAVFSRSAAEHALVLAVHHVVADLWSIAVLVRELGAFYGEETGGPAASLEPLTTSFAEYVLRQRELADGPAQARSWEHWRAQLASPLPVLELSTDRPRPPLQTYGGAVETLRLDAELSGRIAALARSRDATLYVVLLAAFHALLHRLTGQEDLLVGSPTAGRGSRALAGVVGYFVNPVVLRAEVTGGQPFEDLLQRVRRTALDAFAHQDVPFLRLAERLQPERDPGRSPLFQAMFTLQRAPRPEEQALAAFALGVAGARLEVGGLTLESLPLEERSSQLDLSLTMAELPEGLAAALQINSDLFDAATARRMLACWRVFLGGLVAEPGRPVGDLPLLTAEERAQVLGAWAEGGAALSGPLLHEAVAARAEETPEAPAVLSLTAGEAEVSLTYAELRHRFHQLAHHLQGMGVGPEVPVGILLDRSPEAIVALLGVLAAGGACLPLDPAHPAGRLAELLAGSGAEVLLTRRPLLARLGPAAAGIRRVVDLEAEADAIARRPGTAPAAPVLPGNLAYVFHTSGSTGKPKKVGLEHRSLAAYLAGMGSVWGVRPGDRVLQFASLGFDTSIEEIFLALGRGAALVLRDEEMLASTERFFATAGRCGVTVMSLPTAFWHQLAGDLGAAGPVPAAPLRLLILGGETARADRLARWQRHAGPRIRVLNTYGPTESTVVATVSDVTGPQAVDVPIGRPAAGIRCHILAPRLQPVPAGVAGELYLGGAGLARGYLGQPDRTAERFVPDPWAAPGERLYRTGDRARFLPDGTLLFCGRVDDQVKIRGVRVEPGEVEAALAAHPAVRDAVVVARQDAPGAVRLVAYAVPAGADRPSAAELRAFLAARLPEALVPAACVVLDEIPLTPNGKVDRRRLPEPERPSGAGGRAPRNPLEEALAGIWRTLLEVERVGLDDNFFALGGHSLLATRLTSRVAAELGVDLPLADVFAAGTLGELARRVEAAAAREPRGPLARRRESAEGAPLSFAQERLWVLDQLEPGSPAYNMPATVRLEGALDLPAFRRSLSEIVRRHEVLRTTFRGGPQGPRQHVVPSSPVPLPEIDLSALPPPARSGEAGRLARDEARRPFDLAAGPLLRAALLRLAPGERVLLANLHHIAADGWSIEVLLREAAALYAAFSHGLPSPLPDLPWQYADFAVWQREHLRGAELDRQIAWWREQLSDAPVEPALPIDLPPGPAPGSRGELHSFSLPPALVAALRELGDRGGATLFMVLLAGCAALLHRWSGEDDVSVGSPVANRSRPEIQDLIGFFVNTLVLRTRLAGRLSSAGFLDQVRQTALGAYAHQEVPFERLVEVLRPERALGRDPFFQVMFSLQNAAAPQAAGELALRPEEIETGIARWSLAVELAEDGGHLAGRLRYRADRFHATTIARLAERFRHLLEGMAAAPERPVAELPLLGAAERQQLLVEWNDTARGEGQGKGKEEDRSVPELFDAQVERTPEAVALSCGELELTYRELGERVRRLAHHLRRLGVEPEVRVGLCVERSPDLVVSLLGVLAAGGAFVPLDPAAPAERLSHLLRDAGASFLVTREPLAARLSGHGARPVLLDAAAAEIAGAPATRPGWNPAPGDAAYLIYTSGTTGGPKAVLVEHGSLSHTLAASRRLFGWNEQDRMPCLAPFSFDIALFELLNPLLAGGSCVLFPHEPTLDLAAVAAALPRLTRLHAVPAVLRELIRTLRAAGPDASSNPERLGGLRTLFVGGDAVPADLLVEVRETFPAAAIHVLYGPTEGTIICASHSVPAGPPEPRLFLGRPLPGVTLVLFEPGGEPAPIGVAGELCIAGQGVARGYLGREELTAERFVQRNGRRLYRTGDRARWLPDGTLEFLGRLDQQVKVRGIRIEPGEVEAALLRHPGLRHAVVEARGEGAERRLVAWVVPAQPPAPAADELRSFLREIVPEHLVPGAFVALEALPLTPHGKVDRRALPDPGPAAESEASTAPRTPAEEIVAGLWSELLGRERIRPEESFFELGGHSLLATRVASRLGAAFAIEVPLRWLFETPVLADLARRIEEAARRATGVIRPPLTRAPRGLPIPLSFAQQRLWFLDRLEPGNPVYNIASAVLLDGPLDAAALEESLAAIVRRHEALRTRFLARGGEAAQVVDAPGTLSVPRVDLGGLPEPERQAELRRLAREEAGRGFDLERGPLLRAALLRLAPERHAILFTLHHIVADGWSMGVLVRELAALYPALHGGEAAPLPELPIQYGDFAVWQRQWLTGAALDASLASWRERLAGLEPLELPTDRPRPAIQGFAGATEALRLPSAVTAALRELGRGRGATLFMTLLAAFQVVLWRHSGQRDLAVGTPVANRTLLEIEGLIGFFVNMLVLRGELGDNLPFAAFLERTRQRALEAYAHQALPFEKLVEELRPERSLSHQPLFQVALVLNEPWPRLELPGLAARPLPAEAPATELDLLLELQEEPGGLEGHLRYRAELFDRVIVARLAGHLETLLAGLAAAVDRPLRELPWLPEVERHQMLVEWNDTAGGAGRARSLPELFAERAERAPEAVAVVAGELVLSYGELRERAGALARWLGALGVRRGDVVGLAAGRTPETVAGMLGILAAGAGYLPLDSALPRERLALLVRDAGVRLVLADGEREGVFAGLARVERLDLPVPAAAGSPERPGPDDLAYVLYTSGSTGVPKGVAVPHRAVARLVLETGFTRLGRDEVFLQLAPLSFDASTLEIWAPLLNGGRLILFEGEPSSVPEIGRALATSGITSLWLTAGLFQALVDEDLGALGGLRQLLAGGDVLSVPHVRRVREAFPHLRLINGYGPTENTTFTCCETIGAVEEGPVPIGRPIVDTRVWVLDGALDPVPLGGAGELCAGGDGLALGYVGRPDLTAERFVPAPVGGGAGARVYRTGDRVRRRGDGRVEFLGRLDQQVKIRGFRIEPGEVEAALLRHPAVREAAVAARGEGASARRLVAWLVPAGPSVPAAGELRAFLRELLPEPLIPSAFVILDELPLTPNGKVDRRALPSPEEEPAGRGAVAPRTPAEEIVAAVWSEVLGVARVSVDESFFDLGGHSLLATQAVSRLSAAFGREVPLRWLFEAPTVAELARQIEEGARLARGIARPPLAPAPRGLPRPLSFAQQRLWFLDRLQPGNPAYNISAALRLEGPLGMAALERSLAEIVRRHEALRTRFVPAAGEAVQEVSVAAAIALPVVDLGALTEPAREAELARLARQDAELGFNLELGPVLRTTLVRLAAAQQAVLLTLHHIVADGWSMGVLVREVAALYPRFRAGHSVLLPELPVQYGDFALWQRQWLEGETLDRELAFWRERLAGLEPLELPTDRPRPAVQGFRGATETLRLPAPVAAALRELGRRRGGTLFMTLLAAFQILLWRHTGQRDLAVGSPVANRTLPEIEGLIGFFVNMLVLRGDLAGEPALGDLLERVRGVALEAYAHQDLPFEKLVEELRPERRLSAQPLFQVALVLNAAPPPLELPGLAASPVAVDTPATQFDLILEIQEAPGGLSGHLRYRTELFDRTTVARLGRHLETLLADLPAGVDRPLRELPWLSAAERHQMWAEWNDTASAFGRERTIPELFAAQAEATPEAVAVVAGERSLSYGELRERAGRLARRLRGMGARRDDVVGLSTGRSPELVIGMLAILEAGAAYLPLDAAYPRERLALLIRNAGLRLVLADAERESTFAGLAEQVIRVDGEEAEDGGEPERPDALDLAYVMYTSGSTGTPKGVAVPHRAVVRLVRETTYARLDRDQVFLQLAPVAFDASTLEVWGPLLQGGRVVLYQGEPSSVAEIGRALLESEATSLFLTSGLFQALVDGHPDGMAKLRQLMTGGDILSMPHVRRLRQKHPDLRLIHVYGPTENTTFSSFAPVGEAGERVVPIGRPIANTTMYVLSAELETVPPGGIGELCVGGDGLARSYLGRPGLTAEKLVPDPCSGEPGSRLYRTGDLTRLLPGGEVDFLGRVDGQVKIRGFRIEPGEVETALRAHPAVREAVVVPRGEGAGGRRLVAYLVPAGPVAPTAGDLRRFLSERLPEHLVPSLFVALESLPLNANGKVDRRALPDPGREALGVGEGCALPQTPTEEILAGIWGEVLGRGRVGVDESFFDLGGHSLLATQAVIRMSAAFGLEVPLRWLFEIPTVAELARQIDESARRAGGVARPPLSPAPRDLPLPLSFAQQRIWFLDRLDPGSSSYNVPVAVRFDGNLAAELLARGLGEVVRRHEALRTRFVLAGAEPVQVIDPPGPVALGRVDLRSLPADARQAESARLAAAEARRPFDLERGPVFRALLLWTGAEEHRLLLTFHHVVADGWSMGILVRELTELYGAGVLGRAPELPELPVQYADFAQWQRSWLRGDTLDEQLSYWRAQLAGAPAELPLPTDRRRPESPSFRAERRPLALAPDLMASLGALARRERATLFMVLLAGFQTLLVRCSGQADVIVGTPIAGRGHAATEGLIGFFANTLALRADLAGNPTFREVLEWVRRATLDAYAHQDLPFEKLVEALRPERSQGRNPLFAVLFALQNAPLAPPELPGLRVAVEDLETGVAKFDLVLSLAEAPDGLRGGMEYDAELFEAATIDGLLGQYETLLRAVVQDPEARIARIPLTARPPAQRRRALPADLEKLLERI